MVTGEVCANPGMDVAGADESIKAKPDLPPPSMDMVVKELVQRLVKRGLVRLQDGPTRCAYATGDELSALIRYPTHPRNAQGLPHSAETGGPRPQAMASRRPWKEADWAMPVVRGIRLRMFHRIVSPRFWSCVSRVEEA